MYLYPNLYDEKLFNAPTLYDVIERYGYTMGDVLGTYPIWDETKRDWLNNIPGSCAILLFTASDLASITSHIHSWVFFLLLRYYLNTLIRVS